MDEIAIYCEYVAMTLSLVTYTCITNSLQAMELYTETMWASLSWYIAICM